MGFTVKTESGYGTTYVETYRTYSKALRHALRLKEIAALGERVSVVQRVSTFRDNTITVL